MSFCSQQVCSTEAKSKKQPSVFTRQFHFAISSIRFEARRMLWTTIIGEFAFNLAHKQTTYYLPLPHENVKNHSLRSGDIARALRGVVLHWTKENGSQQELENESFCG